MLWKPIDFIEGIPADKYEISENGDIRNKYWIGIRDDINVTVTLHPETKCPVVSLSNTRPKVYHAKKTSKTSKYVMYTIARLVAEAFIAPPYDLNEDDLNVFHIDGDVMNNHYTNLEWRLGDYKIEDRKRMLEIIRDHHGSFSNSDIAKMIQKELGFKVTETLVLSTMQKDKDGKPKSKHWEILGVDPSFFTNKPPKSNPDLIRLICSTLCRFNGDKKATRAYLKSMNITVRSELVNSILNKYSHSKISDEYFEYTEWDGFHSKI